MRLNEKIREFIIERVGEGKDDLFTNILRGVYDFFERSDKKTLGAMALAAPVAAAIVAPAQAQEQVQTGFTTDCLSKYVFRGFTYSDKPVVQNTVCANRDNWTVIGFTNHDSRRVNEADITVDYTKGLNGDLSISAGYTLLTFPKTGIPNTQEVYGGLTWNRPLSPTLMLAHDFDQGRGTYGEVSISHDLEGLGLEAALGYNNHYFREGNGLSHAELRLNRHTQVSEVTLTPTVAYSKSLDKDFEDQVYGGFSLGF